VTKPVYEDPVVAEIHAIRAQMLAECGGDYEKFMEGVRERQGSSGRKVIPAPPPTPPETRRTAPFQIASPRLAHPARAADFVKEVIPESPDAGTPPTGD
jgi:hypothetical protein